MTIRPKVAIAATFTAEPLSAPLAFWLELLDLELDVAFAPFGQVHQTLLDPAGPLASNEGGVAVVLVRVQDLAPARGDDLPPELAERARELARAVIVSAERSRLLHVLAVARPSPELAARRGAELAAIEAELARAVERAPEVTFLSDAELAAWYPVADFADPRAEALGAVPYTSLYFATLATGIARKLHAARTPAKKVIALDCDQTLWSGVAAEDGPMGVGVTGPWRTLQERMLEAHDAGLLLVIASKNNEADVREVFDRRSDLVLRREHFAAFRVDWTPKADSLRDLAAHLGVGLDSFVFIDDNPIECADVQTAAPEVLSLALPSDPAEIPHFLAHVWPLDARRLTAEDRARNDHYRANARREAERTSFGTLDEFLASLELVVEVRDVAPGERARVAQLTQRTNQFNTSGERRTEGELTRALDTRELEGLAVTARDRFGDYGLVGAVLFAVGPDALHVDTFVLSCRALGKGVEHQVLRALGARAEGAGLASVVVRLVPSGRNRPALDFFASIPGGHRGGSSDWLLLPVASLVDLSYRPSASRAASAQAARGRSPSTSGRVHDARSAIYARIAGPLSRPEELLQAVDSWRRRERPSTAPIAAPESALEALIAEEAASILGLEKVGARDNFFEIGGSSLSAVRLISRVRERIGIDLPIERLFAGPTVRELAAALGEQAGARDELLALDRLTEDEAAALLEELSRSGEDASLVLARSSPPASLPELPPGVDRGQPPLGPAHALPRRSLLPAPPPELLAGAAHASPVPAGGDPSSPRFASLGLITKDRLALLERALASYADNTRRFGRAVDLVVADDSESSATRARTRAAAAELARRMGSRVYYAGEAEKSAFASRLIALGAPPEVVRFALFDVEGAGHTVGANRNALLLDSAGELLFITDDDTVCRPAELHGERAGLALTSGFDPAEVTFHADRDEALQSVRPREVDLLGAHEGLLGRPFAAIAGDRATGEGEPSRAPTILRDRLSSPAGLTLATFNGLAGDCAWGAPFGFWGDPMGCLLLEGRSHAELVATADGYRRACTTREIVRATRGPTLSDGSFAMCTFVGLDFRELQPPHFPVRRGQDTLFGTILWRCFEHGWFGHVPLALTHAPTELRRFWPGEIFRTASSFDTARLMLAAVASWSPGQVHPSLSPAERARSRLRELGAHLEALGGLPMPELERQLRASAARQNEAAAERMVRHVERHGGGPEPWAGDVRRYADLLAKASAREDYLVPLDLLSTHDAAGAKLLARRLLGRFGRLLVAWPELADLAKRLRREGHRLAIPLSPRAPAEAGAEPG